MGYYRAAADQETAARQAPQPTLYLHGARDGCIGVDLVRGAERLLAPSPRMIVIDEAGHLHLEEPGQVNDHILSWVG
jgi:pimeloyl-ACP methyl ester carboxylesterase